MSTWLKPLQRMRCIAVAALLGLSGAAPVLAQDDAVDVELVLAVDVSWSMDHEEQRVQREGYAAAFRHPDVITAILHGGWGRIAVTYVEWAGSSFQDVVVPWTVIEDAAGAEAFASALSSGPIGRLRRTSISEALVFAGSLFDRNGVRGLRRVIDVSGDGPNNQGRPVTEARDAIVAQGITINGLPILINRSYGFSSFDIEDLDSYYEDCVIGGFGAFIVPVREVGQFPEAIRRKLVLEIASAQARPMPAQMQTREPRINCLIGEMIWQQRRRYFDDF